jgi:hypothetical protein
VGNDRDGACALVGAGEIAMEKVSKKVLALVLE